MQCPISSKCVGAAGGLTLVAAYPAPTPEPIQYPRTAATLSSRATSAIPETTTQASEPSLTPLSKKTPIVSTLPAGDKITASLTAVSA